MNGLIADAVVPGDWDAFWDNPCRDEPCRAAREMICAMDSYAHRLTPNSLAYPTPEAAHAAMRGWARNIQALGAEHPKRIPLYCASLARIASRLSGDNRQDGWANAFVGDLATRLSRYDPRCLSTVIAAWPRTGSARPDLEWLRGCQRSLRSCPSHDPDWRGGR